MGLRISFKSYDRAVKDAVKKCDGVRLKLSNGYWLPVYKSEVHRIYLLYAMQEIKFKGYLTLTRIMPADQLILFLVMGKIEPVSPSKMD